MVLCPSESGRRDATLVLGGSTDNQGNAFAVSKMLTTRFPLNAVLMEVAAQCLARGIRLHLSWTPRGQNVEADELSNGLWHRFAPGKRVAVDLETLGFLVLPRLLEACVVQPLPRDLHELHCLSLLAAQKESRAQQLPNWRASTRRL